MAVVLGALFISPTLRSGAELASAQLAVDVTCGVLAVVLLWWRRRRPVGVALSCLLLGTLSISATPAGLLAQFSLAVHAPARRALLVAGLWGRRSCYSPSTARPPTRWPSLSGSCRSCSPSPRGGCSSELAGSFCTACATARNGRKPTSASTRTAHGWLSEPGSPGRCTTCSGTGSRCWRYTLGPLEVRPDLPAAEVRATAELMRLTARQALEELRTVIGVLREVSGGAEVTPPVPQPTLADIPRWWTTPVKRVAQISLDVRWSGPTTFPEHSPATRTGSCRRHLTNIGKHASGSDAHVLVTAPPTTVSTSPCATPTRRQDQSEQTLPGRAPVFSASKNASTSLAAPSVHGPDGSGDFVVQADLPW